MTRIREEEEEELFWPSHLDFCHTMLCICAAYALVQCLSVCLSIRSCVLSVETNKHILKFFFTIR